MNILEKEIQKRIDLLNSLGEKRERLNSIREEQERLEREIAEVNVDELQNEINELNDYKARLGF